MLVHGFWISRKCGRGGGEWGHQQGTEHMVAARHGSDRASQTYLIWLEVDMGSVFESELGQKCVKDMYSSLK